MGRQDSIERVIDFISCLTHTTGPAAGQPFELRDWQIDILERIYGPLHDDGRRKTRTAFITIPRKNGKTELAAALALYHLLGDGEKGGQVYSAASDRGQAALIFNAAAAMVRNDPELEEMLNVIESQKRIVHYASNSFYAALSSESKSKHGFSASVIIYDELAQAPNRNLWDVLTTSTGARSQPLTIVISTVSPKRTSLMYELLDYGRKVLDGVIEDETFVPIIYQAPEDADIWDEAVWHECNPALGDFRSLEEMRTMAQRAQRMPSAEAAFRNLYLNQLVDAEQHFLSSTDWLACKGEIDLEALEGRECWGGLDLSSTIDLTALVLVFPRRSPDSTTEQNEVGSHETTPPEIRSTDTTELSVLCWFWVPGDRLREREEKDNVPYPAWASQGHISAPPGRAIDKGFIVHKLAELAGRYKIQGVAYDRWRIEDLRKQLTDEGIDLKLVDWGQGFKDMGPAVDHLEAAVINRELRHDNPVLDWCASNAVTVQDPAGARKIAKDRAIERVDGLVALTMALGLYNREPPAFKSVYSERGLLSIEV